MEEQTAVMAQERKALAAAEVVARKACMRACVVALAVAAEVEEGQRVTKLFHEI